MADKVLAVVGERPADIPADWLIYNAPRPIWGHREWQGDFRHGMFYAAVDPAGADAERMKRDNRDYDAWLLSYATPAEARAWARSYYIERGLDADEVDELLTDERAANAYMQVHSTKGRM